MLEAREYYISSLDHVVKTRKAKQFSDLKSVGAEIHLAEVAFEQKDLEVKRECV